MSRSEQERREQEARRARRLAERAEQRARRKAEHAKQAAERAERLAERVSRRPRREQEDRFEDKFDRMAERWEKKAEAWIESTFGADDVGGYSDDDLGFGDEMGDGMDDGTREDRESRRERDERRRAREAREARAEARRKKRERRERRKRRYSNRTFSSRFKTGRGLYRDKERGKICGVCAGTADYLDVETWQVRLFAVLGLIFVPSFAVPAYFIAYFLMDDKPYYRRVTDKFPESGEMEADDMPDDPNEPDEPRQPDLSNAEAFRQAKQKFADLEERLRSMETHVTSSRFELQRELKKISGDEV